MKHLNLLFLFLILISCGKDPIIPPKPPEPPTEIPVGFSYNLETPDADKALTITFRAASTSELFNYTGEAYIHTGVIAEGVWLYVPADWDENIDKCRMTRIEPNIWRIELKPTIREWFGSGTTPVNRLGIVIRSADGTKKGIIQDSFVNVTDEQFQPFEPAEIKRATLPAGLQHGINIIDNSTVTLVLFDKDTNGNSFDFAHVVGDFNNWTLSNTDTSQMFRDDAAGVWWITLNGLNATTEYAFQYFIGRRAGNTLRIADPYARKILDPWNDRYIPASTYPNLMTFPAGAIGLTSVFQIQREEYIWQVNDFVIPSRDNLVIYELLLRDFTASGDINGAIEKLDYLQSLGVNAISLMPVQEFDGNDSWGYNPAFFFALDKAYGTDNMYKRFVDESNKRGIAVILDVVYNHATGANPWVRMWWDSLLNRPASYNPFFNPFAPHGAFGWFYDFNHESDLVRNFVKRNLQFLLEEYRFSGFRFDFTKGFTQKRTSTNEQLSARDDSRIAILKDYNDAVLAVNPDAFVILEHFTDDEEEIILSNAGMIMWRNMNDAYSQSGMGWSDRSDFRRAYYGTASRPVNSLVSYMESHDEERVAYRQSQWGNGVLRTNLAAQTRQLATSAAFFFTIPGPVMIWQFGEMAYDVSIDYNGRTGRKPVRWEYLDVPERRRLHDTYTQLIALRHNHPELFAPTATLNWQVTPAFWNNGRFLTLSSFGNEKRMVVVGNFTNNPINATTTFPTMGAWYNYMNPQETINATSPTMSISVPANDFRMFSTFAP
ncbi:MAG: alpha-amylase [Dysgonamonadaceae bacterium]|jgi:1,4-alpha-glucan branching enzyme|nr:alpha-amylase [Dysgonamonadaceae bacterium]